MKKELIKILETEEIQERVGRLLVIKGYAKQLNLNKGFKYSNLNLTEEGENEIKKAHKINIPDEWITSFRALFPEGRRGNRAIIKDKLEKFIIEFDCSLDDVYAAVIRYIRNNTDPQYICNANNFFYKKEDNKLESSYCEEYLREDNSDIDGITDDYRKRLA